MPPPIRLMIVDDSLFTRKLLQQMVEGDPGIEVVALASNGAEAVEKARQLKPDLITLDGIMPVMDGLEALKHIMRESPTQVLMISGVTTEGAEITLDALALGAADFLAKPTSGNPAELGKLRVELLGKIHAIAGQRLRVPAPAAAPATAAKHAAAAPPPMAASPKPGRAPKKRSCLSAPRPAGPTPCRWSSPSSPETCRWGC